MLRGDALAGLTCCQRQGLARRGGGARCGWRRRNVHTLAVRARSAHSVLRATPYMRRSQRRHQCRTQCSRYPAYQQHAAAMAPPKGGRGKKLAAPDHELPGPAELLQLIEETGDLPVEYKLQLLHCAQGACPPGCKGGRKDNPACLCGIIPEEGRYKKSGLFQKVPTALGQLGVDPATQRRAVRGAGRGLASGACAHSATLLAALASPGRDAAAHRPAGAPGTSHRRSTASGGRASCARSPCPACGPAPRAQAPTKAPAPTPAPSRRRPRTPRGCATWATRATSTRASRCC